MRGRELHLQRFQIGLDTPEKRRKFALAFRKLLDRWQMAYNSYGLFGDSDTISSQEILNVSGFPRLR
jgi:hypothetical protein